MLPLLLLYSFAQLSCLVKFNSIKAAVVVAVAPKCICHCAACAKLICPAPTAATLKATGGSNDDNGANQFTNKTFFLLYHLLLPPSTTLPAVIFMWSNGPNSAHVLPVLNEGPFLLRSSNSTGGCY